MKIKTFMTRFIKVLVLYIFRHVVYSSKVINGYFNINTTTYSANKLAFISVDQMNVGLSIFI